MARSRGPWKIHRSASARLKKGRIVVILTDTGVVVVDASPTPAAANIVVEEIRKLTDQPVHTVVTTHGHEDHFGGNQAFRDAFPGVDFIAHANTRRDIEDTTVPALEENRRSLRTAVEQRQSTLDRGTDEDGNPLSDAQREALAARVEMFRALGIQMATTEPVLPTEVFSEQMTLYHGQLEIRILHLGPGHTEGDTVVYHGEVQRDRTHVALVIEVVDSLLAQVRQAVESGLGLDETLVSVDLGDLETRLVGEDATMRGGFRQFFLTPAIENAYAELTSRDARR